MATPAGLLRDASGLTAARGYLDGLRASARAGGARLSFHIHNDDDDVDRALEALDGLQVTA